MQLFGMVRGARNFVALETSRATLRRNEERTRSLTQGVTKSVEERQVRLKQLALRSPVFERRSGLSPISTQANQPNRVTVQRMASILERVDRARQQGIPLTQAFGKRR